MSKMWCSTWLAENTGRKNDAPPHVLTIRWTSVH